MENGLSSFSRLVRVSWGRSVEIIVKLTSLQNDDGPPSASSPNIYGFAKLLKERLGWEVKVVIPDCQKSW